MYEACKREKAIKFHFSTACESINSWGPQPSFIARPRNGTPYVVEADVLLAADGVKSIIRDQMLSTLGADAQIIDTGQASYRIMLRRDQMAHDPELLSLIDSPTVTRWVGERRHIIAYPVSSKRIYNISTAQPDEHFAAAPSASYTTRGSKAQMRAVFADFCPLVLRMLDLVPDGDVCEWKLRVHSPLPSWVLGPVALVGDACHPTLPHLAQGAAQAVEDAAVLAVVLRLAPLVLPVASGAGGGAGAGARDAVANAAVLYRTLKVYEELRKERTMALVEMAAASGRAMHLGEGKAREERDRMLAALKGRKGAVPDKWADAEVQQMIYGYDCVKVAEESFASLYQSLRVDQPVVREQSRI
jgi:salicylate hydroxylase